MVVMLCACGEADKTLATGRDTADILRAALAWADTFGSPPTQVPIVLLDEPGTTRPASPIHFGGPMEAVSAVGLPLGSARDSSDLERRVLLCPSEQGFRSEELCGVRPPWRIILVSVPHIAGDSAVVGIDLVDVRSEYDGGEGFLLLVERAVSGWNATGRQTWGILD